MAETDPTPIEATETGPPAPGEPTIASLPSCLTIYFDGATEPRNPGGWETYGWIILDTVTGAELVCGKGVARKPGPKSTNNHAEYCGLGFALRWLADHHWQGEELHIFGDSALVINQVIGDWKCNAPHLIELRERIWELLKQLGGKHAFNWIPRDKNHRCDLLSQEAYVEATGQPFPHRRRK